MSFQCQRDSYAQSFTSRVVSCEPAKLGEINGYEVVLEDTILFPEGGGQVKSSSTSYSILITSFCTVRSHVTKAR